MRLGELIDRKISEIKPYENNTKKHPIEQIEQIANSIKEFGFADPILVNEKGIIIAGHGRYEASKKLKLKTVPVITIYDLSDTQENALRIAHNKLTINSGFDNNKLKLEVEKLLEDGFDLNLTGFSDDEFAKILETLDDIETDNDNYGNDDDDDYEYDGDYEEEEYDEDEGGGEDNNYTKKIEIPIYQITGEKPKTTELTNNEKQKQLLKNIKKAELPEDIKQFLITATYRHTVFNYEKIAEFYAHSTKEIQELMEESALVIIDFNDAIKNGYTRLSKEVAKQLISEYKDEE